jgi:hypothetical protein
MLRIFVIAVITAMAAILETAADAIAATLPAPAPDTDRPRLRVVASGMLCLRLLIVAAARERRPSALGLTGGALITPAPTRTTSGSTCWPARSGPGFRASCRRRGIQFHPDSPWLPELKERYAR